MRTALGPNRPAEIYVFDGCEDGAAERLAAADLLAAHPEVKPQVMTSVGLVQFWSGRFDRAAGRAVPGQPGPDPKTP